MGATPGPATGHNVRRAAKALALAVAVVAVCMVAYVFPGLLVVGGALIAATAAAVTVARELALVGRRGRWVAGLSVPLVAAAVLATPVASGCSWGHPKRTFWRIASGVNCTLVCRHFHGDGDLRLAMRAWVDEDADGRWGSGEPPLPGVRFQGTVRPNGGFSAEMAGAGGTEWSDARGVAVLAHAIATRSGDPEMAYEVFAEPPPGYRATTALPVRGCGRPPSEFAFGFAR